MFKEPPPQTTDEPGMDRLTISVLSRKDTWFGVIIDNENRLVASSFSKRTNPTQRLIQTAKKIIGSRPKMTSHPYAQMMSRIFDGQDSDQKVKYSPVLTTAFQTRVYQVLKQIPRSRVTTYGMIASAIGSGPRAVGTAVGSNPWPLFVPCHRVVPFDLSVGNYSLNQHPDREGSRTKDQLLRREGVVFQQYRIHPQSVWKPR